jgi:hypothetical protein
MKRPSSGPAAVILLIAAAHGSLSTPGGEGRIERIATLRTARAVHSATALPDGSILVAGGMGGSESGLSTAERIDVSTGRVEPVAALVHGRSGHTATALPDGRVVLAGGYDGTYLSSVEVFDPLRGWFDSLGSLNEGRSGHTATLLPDGRILIAGGVGQGWTFLASAELFDPQTGTSQPVGSLSVPRESHTATLLTDERVLVVGGHRGRHEPMEVYASAEVFDPVLRQFAPAGTMATARHKHDAVRLADGRVLVLGGADRTDRGYYASTEIYDPSAGTFIPGPTMTNTRYKMQGTAVLLRGGDVLVAAGARMAEVLDAGSFRFHPVAGGFPSAYYFATATPLPNGDVVIIGGYGDGASNTGGVWRFRR